MQIADKSQRRLRRMLMAALFVALAYVSRFVFHFNVMFLTFEFKDAIITIGGMFLGPLWALGMSVATALLEFITISDTGVYGLIMNAVAATAFSVVASLVYRYKRTLLGAITGLGLGVVALVGVMIPLNLLVTPRFMGVSVATVASLIPKLLLPFNFLKGTMNMAVCMLLYKPVTRALRAVHLADTAAVTIAPIYTSDEKIVPQDPPDDPTPAPSHFKVWMSHWLVPLLGVSVLAASLLLFFLVLHGNVSFGS